MTKVLITPEVELPIEAIVYAEIRTVNAEVRRGADPEVLEDIGYTSPDSAKTDYPVVGIAAKSGEIALIGVSSEENEEWNRERQEALTRIAAAPKPSKTPRKARPSGQPTVAQGKKNARKAVARHKALVPKQRIAR